MLKDTDTDHPEDLIEPLKGIRIMCCMYVCKGVRIMCIYMYVGMSLHCYCGYVI